MSTMVDGDRTPGPEAAAPARSSPPVSSWGRTPVIARAAPRRRRGRTDRPHPLRRNPRTPPVESVARRSTVSWRGCSDHDQHGWSPTPASTPAREPAKRGIGSWAVGPPPPLRRARQDPGAVHLATAYPQQVHQSVLGPSALEAPTTHQSALANQPRTRRRARRSIDPTTQGGHRGPSPRLPNPRHGLPLRRSAPLRRSNLVAGRTGTWSDRTHPQRRDGRRPARFTWNGGAPGAQPGLRTTGACWGCPPAGGTGRGSL